MAEIGDERMLCSGQWRGGEEDETVNKQTESTEVEEGSSEERLNDADNRICRDAYRSCSLVAASCCWDPLGRSLPSPWSQ